MMSIRIERRGNIEPITPHFMRFLREILGGVSLDEIQDPNHERVDFACLRGLIAVEIKSLEEDAEERLSNLVKELERREDWPVFYGAWPFNSILANLNDPEPVKQRLTERIGRSIVRHLKKANGQLAAHTIAFPRRNLVRVVVLINEDHEVYDPAIAVHVIQRMMARIDNDSPNLESIDAALYLTERHATREGNDIAYPIITITGRSVDEHPWKGDVLDYLVWKWCQWTGARFIAAEPADAAAFVNSFTVIEHIPDTFPRHEGWRLQYHRKPYMRNWSHEQLRARWDELIVRSFFAFLKGAPFRLPNDEIAKDMERFTHILEEIAFRGISMEKFKAEQDRFIAAAMRLQLSPVGLAWVAAQFAREREEN